LLRGGDNNGARNNVASFFSAMAIATQHGAHGASLGSACCIDVLSSCMAFVFNVGAKQMNNGDMSDNVYGDARAGGIGGAY